MTTIEIYFSDLKDAKQIEVLKALNMKDATDGNFELSPLAYYEVEEDEDA